MVCNRFKTFGLGIPLGILIVPCHGIRTFKVYNDIPEKSLKHILSKFGSSHVYNYWNLTKMWKIIMWARPKGLEWSVHSSILDNARVWNDGRHKGLQLNLITILDLCSGDRWKFWFQTVSSWGDVLPCLSQTLSIVNAASLCQSGTQASEIVNSNHTHS